MYEVPGTLLRAEVQAGCMALKCRNFILETSWCLKLCYVRHSQRRTLPRKQYSTPCYLWHASKLRSYHQCLRRKYNKTILMQRYLTRGSRVVISIAIKGGALTRVHIQHEVIVAMKPFARSHAFWLNIHTNIETAVATCTMCDVYWNVSLEVPSFKWELPCKSWYAERINFAGLIADVFQRSGRRLCKWLTFKFVSSITSVEAI